MKYSNLIICAVAIVAPAFVSCAGGASYEEAKASMPAIPKGHGRVLVYRTSVLGMAVKPDVKIDGNVIGTSEAKGFLYSDQKAGSHTVSIKTEVTKEGSVSVKPGELSFVRSSVGMGVLAARITPEQVSKATGEEEIQGCSLSQ
jgi:hypothetical protein